MSRQPLRMARALLPSPEQVRPAVTVTRQEWFDSDGAAEYLGLAHAKNPARSARTFLTRKGIHPTGRRGSRPLWRRSQLDAAVSLTAGEV